MTSIQEWKQMQDMAKHPPHYQGKKFELWDVILDFELGYLEGLIARYVFRWKKKSGLKDLYKARECLEKLIREEEKKRLVTEPYEELAENLDG